MPWRLLPLDFAIQCTQNDLNFILLILGLFELRESSLSDAYSAVCVLFFLFEWTTNNIHTHRHTSNAQQANQYYNRTKSITTFIRYRINTIHTTREREKISVLHNRAMIMMTPMTVAMMIACTEKKRFWTENCAFFFITLYISVRFYPNINTFVERREGKTHKQKRRRRE